MSRLIVRRRLVGRSPIPRQNIRQSAIILVGVCILLVSLGTKSDAQTPPPDSGYPCGSWNAGMVNQSLHEIDDALDDFWNDHAADYGPPEVLTDSHYSNNRSAYIYPSNLGPYVPMFEPPVGASDTVRRYAQIGNACIDLPASSGVPAPYNSFRSTHPNLTTQWKSLADSVTTFDSRSLHMTEANEYHVNNQRYCGVIPRPGDCTSVYRDGAIADAYKLFYNVAIYRGGDGDRRDEAAAHSEDYFRIWARPRNKDATRTTMTYGQFGSPGTIPNNLQNSTGNNGTAVFRNTFEISEADYNLYQTLGSTGGALTIQGIADDYLGVWLNGNPIAFSVKSGNAFISGIDPTLLQAPVDGKSTNVLKLILFDKYILRGDRTDYQQSARRSMGSGLLYSIMYFPPKTAPIRVSCGATTFPDTVAYGKPITFTVGARIAGRFDPPLVDAASPASSNPVISYAITRMGGRVVRTGIVGYTATSSASSSNLTSDPISIAAGALPADKYVVSWTITSPNLSPMIQSCSATSEKFVGYQPYFEVVGGDIWAGTKDPESSAGIRSWNADGVPPGSYAGAGSQIAALASGDIQNFISGGRLDTGVESGYSLSFANDLPTPAGGGSYGGGFRSFPVELPNAADYTCEAGSPGAPSCNFVDTGPDVRIDGGALPAGSMTSIGSDRDVYINGNIIATYGSINDIPHLDIIAGGDIYIDQNVTEIHANLWARAGAVYTCGSYDMETNQPSRNSCIQSLKVYGTVIAEKLHLLRTAGNWADASPSPAEQFIYSPEIWLNRGGGNSLSIDSFVMLPPIL